MLVSPRRRGPAILLTRQQGRRMLRAAVESGIACKERCTARDTSRCMACVMCASSSPFYQEAARPVVSRLGGARVRHEEESRRFGRCSVGGVLAPPTSFLDSGRDKITTMRTERACCAKSEPIARHDRPGVPLHGAIATSHLIHIFSLYTTTSWTSGDRKPPDSRS
jgi:hypothetical protein